jgi:GxxExxY protein
MEVTENGGEGGMERMEGGSGLLLGELTERVVGCCIAVHRELGPGLLESVYDRCVAIELRRSGLSYQRQSPVPIRYRGDLVDANLVLDFLVEKCLVLEIKAVESIHPVHVAQLITYLKLSGHRVGLLINFNVPLLKDGIRRVVS